MPQWGTNKNEGVVVTKTLTAAYAGTVLYAKLENTDQFIGLVQFISGLNDVDIEVSYGWNEDPDNSDIAQKKFFQETAVGGTGTLVLREFKILAADAGKNFRLALPLVTSENLIRLRLKGNGNVVKLAFETSNNKNPFTRI